MNDLRLFVEGAGFYLGGGLAMALLALWIVQLWSPSDQVLTDIYSEYILPAVATFGRLLGFPQPETQAFNNEATKRTPRFRTVREAKDYLAGRISDEAEREGAPLAEIERKMLYFGESGWTLPDMKQVSAEFDRDYDGDAYEEKIGKLISNIESNSEAGISRDLELWDAALNKLSQGKGDHYLLLLASPRSQSAKARPLWLRLFAVVLLIAAVFLINRLGKHLDR